MDQIPDLLQLQIPARLTVPLRMLRAEPGQLFLQIRTLSGKLDAVLIDDILFQLHQKRFICAPICLIIGAFPSELLVGIVPDIS